MFTFKNVLARGRLALALGRPPHHHWPTSHRYELGSTNVPTSAPAVQGPATWLRDNPPRVETRTHGRVQSHPVGQVRVFLCLE